MPSDDPAPNPALRVCDVWGEASDLRICDVRHAGEILGLKPGMVRKLDHLLSPAKIGLSSHPIRVYLVEAVERLAAERDARKAAK